MGFIFSPIVFLILFWLALSGHYTTLLLILGAASCFWVLMISRRMGINAHEGKPIHLVSWRIVPYWIWLIKEILLSTWAVSRMILSPGSSVRPQLAKIPANNMSDLSKVTYANSITLTPGTLTIEAEGDELEIHTLRADMLEPLKRGEMADRVRKIERGHNREQ